MLRLLGLHFGLFWGSWAGRASKEHRTRALGFQSESRYDKVRLLSERGRVVSEPSPGFSKLKKEVKVMLGMGFVSFLTLLVISIVVGLVYHFALRYRFQDGLDALLGKFVVGWVGAWLGSPVLGHWLWKFENVYVIPAILGAIVAVHMNILAWKTLARVASERSAEEPKAKAQAAH